MSNGIESLLARTRRNVVFATQQYLFVLAFAALFAPSVLAVRRIEINDHRDARYMPYSVIEVNTNVATGNRYVPYDCLKVLKPNKDSVSTALVVSVLNSKVGEDLSAQVTIQTYPALTCAADNGVWLEITDFCTYFDTKEQTKFVAGAGYRRDSLFIFKLNPLSKAREFVFVATGEDRTGNGKWQGQTKCVGATDYDFDGRTELFWYVDPIRDREPRLLVCMQMEDMSIEWSLPVASTVLPHQVFSAGTKADPGILFASAPSDLGIADSNFSDSYAYLTRVDNRGHIVFRKLIGVSRENCALWHCQPDSNFYLIHTRPLVDAKTVEDTVGSSNYLTRLNSLGDVLAQVQEPEPAADVWTADFTGDNRPEVYTLSRKGVVRVYDTSLSLLAQSGGSNLTNMTGILPTFGTERNVLVLSNPRGSAVYDRLMRPLAELPFYSQYVEGLEYNSAGDMLALVSSFRERGAIERVQRRGLLDYARIAYLDYQNYVLAVLSSLLIGLLVTNYYRRRVTSQKQHLEEANDELARTHQALQKAQATIVQQEKYKQAKDIAGGFAHEIRNALFPADSSVTKLNELTEKGPLEKETVIRFLTSAGASISRAINITELISRYTKLDSQYLPEKVDLAEAVSDVLNANQLRIAESGVAVVTTEKAGFFIEANRTQFHMVINNLVLNSLDALTNRTNPTIIIKWVIEKEFAHVSISDNGCGIPAENVPKVFDTFYSTKPNRGTGLGLAIAKRIIDMYGGSISVWSEPDKGTRFDVMMKAYGSE